MDSFSSKVLYNLSDFLLLNINIPEEFNKSIQ
jgi:broad specificity polyphosphatase/5'/3'-nucleotidase SurE